MNEIKTKLRAATLGQKKIFKKELVEVNGEIFEIRQPTIGQRGLIRNKSINFGEGEGAGFDMFAFLICAVVELTYVPGTEDRVFSDEDYEELKSIPAGAWFDELTKVASELCNVKSDEVKKPSEETVVEFLPTEWHMNSENLLGKLKRLLAFWKSLNGKRSSN